MKRALVILSVVILLVVAAAACGGGEPRANRDPMSTCISYVAQHGPASVGSPGYEQACP